MKNGSSIEDYFSTVPGPIGVVKPPQKNVLKGYQFRGERGDALRAWLLLFPGNIKVHVAKISAAIKVKEPKAPDLTLGEYVVFHGLFIAASVCVQKGHELWDVSKEERRFRKHPEFGAYMTRNRFDAIKSSLLSACGDASKSVTGKWWAIRPLFDEFNNNRRLTVALSEVQIPDEAMSAFQPRTTASDDLDHLSFVERKPKKLGTEAKCVADGCCGVMRFLEIQEGAEAMALKRHRKEFAPATAQALRLVEGVLGTQFV
jgi:Transposase IS4